MQRRTPDLSRLRLPRALHAVLARCLLDDPALRYRDGQELLKALR